MNIRTTDEIPKFSWSSLALVVRLYIGKVAEVLDKYCLDT
jgi:hypothetical protein